MVYLLLEGGREGGRERESRMECIEMFMGEGKYKKSIGVKTWTQSPIATPSLMKGGLVCLALTTCTRECQECLDYAISYVTNYVY